METTVNGSSRPETPSVLWSVPIYNNQMFVREVLVLAPNADAAIAKARKQLADDEYL